MTKTTKQDFTFAFVQTLKPDVVANVLVSALEGGTGYWAQIDNIKGPDYNSKTCDMIVRGEAHLVIVELDEFEEPPISHRLDRAAVEKGLKIMVEKYPKHMQDIINENDDATTGDVLMQCALLGEVVYG